ncbi:50S ribosomal protein L31 [Candidatus Woesebacteria bacterium RIFCSPHIGHO2_01_FULL_38_9]|uniref:50S ribosomal protein L31 n=2 Tax=Candidatus Woeseibacteriota TaxID=1752722 RepID=A0A1F7Y2L2_9BACT|nr:MAG: 50S ribosomal protein L31 [Candidatus Woesebacteria bacterium RIFCSPHIGHO2_01_FULL_38_9]OGM60189.1 MAG: 50S ribosomal protein L31 [Candidatus Woesebacteria bacterium RIFCSPLOWO2_01_FULL_39_10]
MKVQIHPQWYQAEVVCACGNKFTVGATVPKIEVEVCYNCHPFYTGQMKYVDTAGRVDAFRARLTKVDTKVLSKTEKRKLKKERKIQRELERPDTLAELRKESRKKN